MNRENSIARIILPFQQRLELQSFQLFIQQNEVLLQLLFQLWILFFSEKLL
jgi:hypothetical protein